MIAQRGSAIAAWFLLATAAVGGQQLDLHANWTIQSSSKVMAAPEAISTPGFATAGWYPASVPSTVFNALVENKIYPDPDFGMNLRLAAGVSYKIGNNFSHEEIPADSPYHVSWWFRTQFTLPANFRGRTVWLDFRGINYRANIWLNGRQISDAKATQGTFRRFEFDITPEARPGAANALAVEVFAPRVHDLAITFVDWNPMPPDKDMGLWGKVFLRASGPVAIRQPWVNTRLDLPSLAVAHLTVTADLANATDQEQRGTLRGRIGAHRFSKFVALAPHATAEVSFALDVNHPRLWWPHGMGEPALHHLRLSFVDNVSISDRNELDFGMDEITAAKNDAGAEQFFVNGRKVFVRGGGWTPDMLLRDGPDRWTLDFRYARELNLNTLRLEGKLMDDAFFDLADRNGILIMAGWCCCDHWEEWSSWKDDEGAIATASLRDQALRLRGHASVLVWLNGSDNPPPAKFEHAYLDVLAQVRWPKPILSSASGKKTTVTGESGVKMTGPYDYVPPAYWLAEPQLGGARGFNTETSPGAAIPPIESLRRFIPADHLWTGLGPGMGPDDPYWNFHAGSGQFLNLHRYLAALSARYGAPASLRDYLWKSQAISYEGERAMFEAFGRRQGEATGVIQWMLNNGWPSLIWHLYDYYLRPGAGYYGVQRANEPIHIQYSEFDHTVNVVNHQLQSMAGLSITASRYTLDGDKVDSSTRMGIAIGGQTSVDVFPLPTLPGDSFLKLTMKSAGGRQLSSNFYWLSSQPDVMDLKGATWIYAPESTTANFKPLSRLPQVQLISHASYSRSGDEGAAKVQIANPSTHVAFLIRLRITRGPGGPEVLPVWWQENYISLLPKESRNVEVHYRLEDLHGATPTLAVDGWNVGR